MKICQRTVRTKRVFTYLLFLFVCGLAPLSISKATESLPSNCVNEDCFRVAKRLEWPAIKPSEGISSHFGPFRFLLPDGVKHFGVFPMNPVFSVEYNQGHFVFELIRKQEIEEIIGCSINTSTIKLIDYPRILFQKTPKSPEPEELTSKFVWRWIFDLKKAQFKGVESVFYSEKEDFTAYYTDGSDLGWDCYAIVTSSEYPDLYMTIQGFGRQLEDLKYILSSLSYNQEQ